MRLAVCVPTSGRVPATFAYALSHTIGFFAIRDGFDVTLLMQESSVIHSNREQLVQRALEWQADRILFVDDDMYWPPEAVLTLLSRDLPIVGANYPKRAYPIEMTAVDMDGNRMPLTAESTGVVQCQFSGLGLCLIKAEVFRALPPPWFLPGYMAERAEFTTEDCAFQVPARLAGFPSYIDHDASKQNIQHVGQHMFAWNHVVEGHGNG